MYREITEVFDNHSNRDLSILSIRLFIRVITRLFGYKKSVALLTYFSKFYKFFFNTKIFHFSLYIIEINIFRNKCLYLLRLGKLKEHELEKKKWAKFVIQNSKYNVAVNNAIDYLNLIDDYENYNIMLSNVKPDDKLNFYFYGPNSAELNFHKNHVIVLTKPIKEDISKFKGSILFLNSYYFNKSVLNNKPFQAKLKQKYDKIFVSCKHSKLPEGFNRINPLSEFNSGYLSGPMALGRVLQILMKDYGKFNCIIDGYDFYLDSCPYNDNYSSSLRMSNGFFNDRMISWTFSFNKKNSK